MQRRGKSNGDDGRDETVTYYERWRGLEYLDENLWFGDNRKLASLACWMRRDFPGDEAGPALTGDAHGKRRIIEAMHRSRGEGVDHHCPQYFTWNPRHDYERHWEERRTFLLEQQRRKWEASQAQMRQAWENTQEAERRNGPRSSPDTSAEQQ